MSREGIITLLVMNSISKAMTERKTAMQELETFERENQNLLAAIGGDDEDENNHLRCLHAAGGGDDEDENNHLRCLF
jgi:hypothetical protein